MRDHGATWLVSWIPRAAVGSAVVVLLGTFLVVNLAGIYLTGPYAWDDGAITLAYARTLAEHGIFALTGASEIVEGSSSLLLTVLMTALYRLLPMGFDDFILASQLTAFLWVCLILVLLYRNLDSAIEDPFHRALLVLLLGTLPMFTSEVLNGMEMSLFALLLAALSVAHQARSRWIFVLIPLLLLCRFESIFYLLLAFTLLFWIDPKERRYLSILCIYLLAWFGLITLFRIAYFNDLVPNPVWAKMNPPYTKGSNLPMILIGKLLGGVEFLSTLLPLLVTLALLSFRDSWRSRLDLKVLLVLSFGFFALITGRNAGYQGRMILGCLPLLVLIAGDTMSRYSDNNQKLGLSREKVTIWMRKEVVAPILVLALLAMHLSASELFLSNILTAGYGGYHQDRLPDPVREFFDKRIRSDQQSVSPWDDVTPANYRITGLAVDQIRSMLQLESIKFMVPDVGGLGLCCDKIQVIDSGLLTNRYLARNGWGKFDVHLQAVVPDVVETHGPWSGNSRIYESDFFRRSYVPIVFDNNLLWIHERYLGKLLATPQAVRTRLENLDELNDVRYGGLSVDMNFITGTRLEYVWNIVSGSPLSLAPAAR
jgi:hypothetical protein